MLGDDLYMLVDALYVEELLEEEFQLLKRVFAESVRYSCAKPTTTLPVGELGGAGHCRMDQLEDCEISKNLRQTCTRGSPKQKGMR
jgi:hypothetical protein